MHFHCNRPLKFRCVPLKTLPQAFIQLRIACLPNFVAHMHLAEINITSPECQCAGSVGVFDLINSPALLLLLRPAGVKNNTIPSFERPFQLNLDPLTPNRCHLSEVNPSLLSESRMHELLVIDSSKPSAIQPSRKGHLHFVIGNW